LLISASILAVPREMFNAELDGRIANLRSRFFCNTTRSEFNFHRRTLLLARLK
jgi:hypothetical protein